MNEFLLNYWKIREDSGGCKRKDLFTNNLCSGYQEKFRVKTRNFSIKYHFMRRNKQQRGEKHGFN